MKHLHSFSDVEIEALWRVLTERRDMRHFTPEALPEGLIERLVAAAHLAPSVGFMQPWRFLRITDQDLRLAIHRLVDAERSKTAEALPSRNQEFLKVKVEGILECPELLAVTLMPGRDAHIIGRRTMPDMDLASVGCAIQNMWLAARVEGVGLGWVSFFEPQSLADLLRLPAGARPVALLCIGRVPAFYPRPMFEEAGWGRRLAMDDVLFENHWPDSAQGTPAPY
ncbi:MAG: 5,6-dimethylbenzimidazole synthase [Thiomonas delicata]